MAGNGTLGFSGDGGPATKAGLGIPPDVAVDGAGNLYIVDRNNNRIRKVDTSGTISTFAGNGTQDSSGDGGPALNAAIFLPIAIAVDGAGNVYIADRRRRPPQGEHVRHHQLSTGDQLIAVEDSLTGRYDFGLGGERLRLGSEWLRHLQTG